MKRLVVAALLPLICASTAMAQDRGALIQAISGSWFAFDTAARSGQGACQLQLGIAPTPDAARMGLSVEGCNPPLAQAAAWDINGAQLILYTAEGAALAELGGSQLRMTGVTAPEGAGVILERQGGDQTSAALSRALLRHRCFYLGYSSDCAGPEDAARPVFTSGGQPEVQTLVQLAVRGQPRRDSAVVGTLAPETCVRVEQCLNASDGIWCRARFGDTVGWLGKSAIRQNEWPVVTYRSGCTAAE